MIQIFILTYNRPELIVKALESALNQDYPDKEIIVSDNSTNNSTQEILEGELYLNEEFKYVKRTPSVSWHDHFNLIFSEVTAEYFMIFHDDDLMFSNMLSELMLNIDLYKDKNVVAVGANAILTKNQVVTKEKYRKNIKRDIILDNPTELAKLYMLKNSIVPFSSYLYYRTVAKSIYFDINKGGKYCDVSFLLDVCSLGKMINLEEPLMFLNQHESQISKDNYFQEKLQLISYIVKSTNYNSKDKLVIDFRLNNLYYELSKMYKTNISFFWSKRNFRIILLFIKYHNYEYLLKVFVVYVYRILSRVLSRKK